MKYLKSILTGFVVLTTLVACGSAGGGGDDGGGGGGTGLTGTLIGNGNSAIHTFSLATSNDWLRRLDNTVYDVVALHLPGNELYVAGLNMLDPMEIDVYDLNTFGLKHEWLWPDTVDLHRVHGLAIAPDGLHAAALLSGLGDAFLEVINIETGKIVMTGFFNVASTDMHWISETRLMFAMDLQDETAVEYYGGIVAMDLSQPMSDGGNEVTFEVLVGFEQAQWDSVHGYSLSHDGQQLVYARSGDLWIKDLTTDNAPHQLTTGPVAVAGPAFSPDDSAIAFAELHRYGLESTFVIPNHRTAPILIDSAVTAGSHYLVDEGNLVEEMLVWLP